MTWKFMDRGEPQRHEELEDALRHWLEQNPDEVAATLARLIQALEGTVSVESITGYAVVTEP